MRDQDRLCPSDPGRSPRLIKRRAGRPCALAPGHPLPLRALLLDPAALPDGIEQADVPIAAERALIDYAPLKRIATSSEIATAVLYLASDDARFVTGATFAMDSGSTAGP